MNRMIAVLLLAATPALADETPVVLPNRDVAVNYQVNGAAADVIPGGAPGALRLAWEAAGQHLRAEAVGRTQVAIVDLPAGRASIIESGLRSALEVPFGQRAAAALRMEGAHFTRRKTETVAGVACTDWAVQSGRGSGTVCLTADGVALRGDGTVDGRHGSFVATSVSYAPQPAELFRVPDGYSRMALPSFARPK